ncbi:YcjX family protein [Vibrio lentus]|nr:YcjX family protein [Vibrio lentus]
MRSHQNGQCRRAMSIEIRLAIKYKPARRKEVVDKTAPLSRYCRLSRWWLLDLPLLDMDFDTWSQSQFAALKGDRETYSQPWNASTW